MRSAFKYIGRGVGALFMLVVLLAASLYIPPIQRWAVGKVVTYAEEATGWDINIRAIHISFPLDIELQGLSIKDEGRLLTDVERAIVDLDLSRILSLSIGIEGIELNDGKLDTGRLIATTTISGNIHKLRLEAEELNLKMQHVRRGMLTVDGCDICISMNDTTVVDTTESKPLEWFIGIEQIDIEQSRFTYGTAGDSLTIGSCIRKAQLTGANLQLEKGEYRAKRLMLAADTLRYDQPFAEYATEGTDFNHLVLSNIDIDIDNLCFRMDETHMTADIHAFALNEKSGFRLKKLATKLNLDSASIHLEDLDLLTDHSSANGRIDLDWSSLTPRQRGKMNIDLYASIGHEDVLTLGGAFMPADLCHAYPQQPLLIGIEVNGNVDSLQIDKAGITMPTIMDLTADGWMVHVTDSLQRAADIKWDITTDNLSCIRQYLGVSGVTFPRMALNASTQLKENSIVTADAILHEGHGNVRLKGKIDLRRMAYDALLRTNRLQLHDFLPSDSIYELNARIATSGIGTDMLSPYTRNRTEADIDHLGYAAWDLDSVTLDVRYEKGEADIELFSNNDLLKLQTCIMATISERKLSKASFSMDLSHIDLHAFKMARRPLSASMVMHMDGASDLKQTHRLTGKAEAMELMANDSVFHPVDLTIDTELDPDHISVKATAGDLSLDIASAMGLDNLFKQIDSFIAEIKSETDSLYINQDTLRTLLPPISANLRCGQRNPISNILRLSTGYTMREVDFSLFSGPEEGLSGQGHIHAFNTGAILIDTIGWRISQDNEGVKMDAQVINGPKNRIVSFRSLLHADLTPTGANANLLFYDGQGKKGVDLGFGIDMTPEGIRTQFMPLNPIIAYRRFTLNKDNFIQLTREGRLDAMIDLLADDGTGLKLYTTPNEEAKQDISLSINHLNLGELTSVIPFTPVVEGFLNGDYHYMQADSTLTISADMVVNEMTYNEVRMGDIGINGVYFPNSDGSHYVDGIITVDGNEVVYLNGGYSQKDKEEGRLDATASLQRLPFALCNAFLPKETIELVGYTSGDLTVEGKVSNPIVTGEIQSDSLHIKANSYNIDLQVPNKAITIDHNLLQLGHIEAYAAGNTPLTLDGTIDFLDVSDIKLALNIAAKDYLLINAPKSRHALAYGKVYIDLNSRINGTLNDLKMRGIFTVLGKTDVTYVLRDSPLTVDDQLADLITFVDFTDTTTVEDETFARQNIDVQMRVTIEQAAQVHCMLSDDGNDYINLQGGGELTLSYDTQNSMRLYGRYTIEQGLMRYSLMAIPLNDFKMKTGSFVEFNGDLMNPRLNIEASERIKATVNENNIPRNVSFDVGLALSKTLNDMGLAFTLQSPEDLTVQNQIDAMTEEERGRVAVTMLVTGLYVTDDAKANGRFNYTNTLNAYLQGAINQIADKAFNTIDLNFGVANSTTDTGRQTTDYSFSFAKRFWGNRISVIIGGKVSTGKAARNTGETIIDNISIEYRLDNSATRYVRLYYDRDYESLLEGQITEMGAGLVLRRKTEHLGELFIFRKKKENER